MANNCEKYLTSNRRNENSGQLSLQLSKGLGGDFGVANKKTKVAIQRRHGLDLHRRSRNESTKSNLLSNNNHELKADNNSD